MGNPAVIIDRDILGERKAAEERVAREPERVHERKIGQVLRDSLIRPPRGHAAPSRLHLYAHAQPRRQGRGADLRHDGVGHDHEGPVHRVRRDRPDEVRFGDEAEIVGAQLLSDREHPLAIQPLDGRVGHAPSRGYELRGLGAPVQPVGRIDREHQCQSLGAKVIREWHLYGVDRRRGRDAVQHGCPGRGGMDDRGIRSPRPEVDCGNEDRVVHAGRDGGEPHQERARRGPGTGAVSAGEGDTE